MWSTWSVQSGLHVVCCDWDDDDDDDDDGDDGDDDDGGGDDDGDDGDAATANDDGDDDGDDADDDDADDDDALCRSISSLPTTWLYTPNYIRTYRPDSNDFVVSQKLLSTHDEKLLEKK